MIRAKFLEQLRSLSFQDTFNPYRDRCPKFDLDGAPEKRERILSSMLEHAQSQDIDAIWIGRDLGHRGGRRTGLALTDDVHFHDHLARWQISTARPTIGEAVSERTAKVVWDSLSQIDVPIFLWNVFPLHPYGLENEFSNRPHTAKEREAGSELLAMLIELLRPRRLVAIGNDAFHTLSRLGIGLSVTKVRHPSYGGQSEFKDQIEKMYALRKNDLFAEFGNN